MGQRDDESIGVAVPPIPESGLISVLSSWSGRGSLFEALSAPSARVDERRWSAADVRLRANRILLERLDSFILRWPRRSSQWLDYLPAARSHSSIVEVAPFSGVDWTASRRRFGWPPSAFVGKRTERSTDMLAVQVLRWCVERLEVAWTDVVREYPDLHFGASDNVRAAISMLNVEPLASATSVLPVRSDLVALRREGAPWGSVAEVVHQFLEAEKSLEHLVFAVLMPDDEIRWRLFHLAVLGVVLLSLRKFSCQIVSVRPLSPQSSGPNYEITRPDGRSLLLWFEASNIWPFHDCKSPYAEATRAVKNVARNNGADILLLDGSRKALILECKYSSNAERVARDGYYQAVAYAAETRSRLADDVVSVAIGPESVVAGASFTTLNVGKVGTAPPSAIEELVKEFLV